MNEQYFPRDVYTPSAEKTPVFKSLEEQARFMHLKCASCQNSRGCSDLTQMGIFQTTGRKYSGNKLSRPADEVVCSGYGKKV